MSPYIRYVQLYDQNKQTILIINIGDIDVIVNEHLVEAFVFY